MSGLDGVCLGFTVTAFAAKPGEIVGTIPSAGHDGTRCRLCHGFFQFAGGKKVGSGGTVLCADPQKDMLTQLSLRAEKAGLEQRIELHGCSRTSLELEPWRERIDFALAVAVAHETPDYRNFFADIYRSLKPSSLFLLAEPRGHVSEVKMKQETDATEEVGFAVVRQWPELCMRCALLKKYNRNDSVPAAG